MLSSLETAVIVQEGRESKEKILSSFRLLGVQETGWLRLKLMANNHLHSPDEEPPVF